MKVPKWLSLVQTMGLAALQASPLAPIAAPVAVAIAEAEAIGGSGPDKLAHVMKAATAAAATAQKLGVNISPELVQAAGATAISTAVQVTNIVHQAQHAPDALPSNPPPLAH